MPAITMAGVDGADYVVWRLPAPGARGLGLMHARTTNTTPLAETVGLKPHSTYRYVGSRTGCANPHTANDVLWTTTLQSNAKGAALLDASRTGNVLTTLRSIRLFRGSTQSECASPLRYSSQGSGEHPTDAFARLSAVGVK